MDRAGSDGDGVGAGAGAGSAGWVAPRVPVPAAGVFERGEPFVVDLDRFQGPMDLLLHLIRQQDIDIFDIPIARITDQFLAAVDGVEEADLDGAGEFLEMAATLVRIKAQMLLPRPQEEEDEDPRAELVRRLLEYEQIREISERLARSESERARRFPKGYVESRPVPEPEDAPLTTTWEEVFQAALRVRMPEAAESGHRVSQRPVAMDDKVRLILDTLRKASRVRFRTLLEPWKEKIHGVMTLLAGLELARRRSIHMRQTRPFADLWIYRRTPEEEGEEQGVEGGEGDPSPGGARRSGGRQNPPGADAPPEADTRPGPEDGPEGDEGEEGPWR